MTVSKDDSQLVAKVLSDDNNEENKYSNPKSENSKRKHIDLDSFVIPSERGQHVDEYMKEMRDDDSFIPHS